MLSSVLGHDMRAKVATSLDVGLGGPRILIPAQCLPLSVSDTSNLLGKPSRSKYLGVFMTWLPLWGQNGSDRLVVPDASHYLSSCAKLLANSHIIHFLQR